MKKVIAGLALFFMVLVPSKAQEEFTLHYLDNALPALYVNPMAQSQYKVSVGVPGLSSYGFGFFNTGFALKSFMTLDGNEATIDLNRFVKRLNRVNFVTAGASADVLAARVNILKNSYSFTWRAVADARVSYPKGVFSIMTEGNLHEPAFKRLGAQVNVYHEFAVGMSHFDDHEKFNYGGRLKVLLGVANVNSNVNASLEVDEDDLFQTQVELDARFKAASLFLEEDADPSVKEAIFGGGNLGLAVDAGATYQWNDKLSFSASLVDFGFIRWKTNPIQVTTDANFEWEGVTITNEAFEDIDSLQAELEGLATEIEEEIEDLSDLDTNETAYTTGLFTRTYLTGHYQILPKTRLSATLFTEFNRGVRPGWIFACTQDVTSNFKVAVDYWGWRNSYANLGLGFVANFGPFQWHMMFDNLWTGRLVRFDEGIFDDEATGETTPGIPYNIRNFNMRFGLALVFGKLRAPVKQSNTSLK